MKLQLLCIVAFILVSTQQSEAFYWGWGGYNWLMPRYYNYFSPYYTSLISPWYGYGLGYGYGYGMGLRYFRDTSDQKTTINSKKETSNSPMNHVHCTYTKSQATLSCLTASGLVQCETNDNLGVVEQQLRNTQSRSDVFVIARAGEKAGEGTAQGIKFSLCPRSADEKALKSPSIMINDAATQQQVKMHIALFQSTSPNSLMSSISARKSDASGNPCGIQVKSMECFKRLEQALDNVTSVQIPIKSTNANEKQMKSVIGEVLVLP